jgi:hypothetical protein
MRASNSQDYEGRKVGKKTGSYNDQPPCEDEPTHSEDGVDLTLIRWMLSLTPAERLKVLENNVRSILRLRGEAEA